MYTMREGVILQKYSIAELATQVGKSPNVVKQWFEELVDIFNYKQKDEGSFNELDVKIAQFITEKREEKWSYHDIFQEVYNRYVIAEEHNDKDNDTINLVHDPEGLFYKIAQDSEVIRQFKYHSLRVIFLASALAKRVDCYDEDLRIAALLHDIGKVAISKHILLKPGRLSELEFTIIQSHCHVGNTIVRKHLGLPRSARFVRDHHERWDGKGYPRSLKGEDITIQGRIIAICDAFDVMTVDHRNYRENKLTYEEALAELQKGAWTQFDGDLVKSFSLMMDEVKIPSYMIKGI